MLEKSDGAAAGQSDQRYRQKISRTNDGMSALKEKLPGAFSRLKFPLLLSATLVYVMLMLTAALLKDGLRDLLDFIFPPFCLLCSGQMSDTESLVCRECWARISVLNYPFCGRCRSFYTDDFPRCACSGSLAVPIFALGQYVDPLKEIVHQLKYHGYRKLGYDLADRLIIRHGLAIKDLRVDYMVPVPLHGYRQKARGFNQAAVLADIIGDRLGIAVDHESLVRVRKTRDQTRLDPLRRVNNVRGAFSVYGAALDGKRVVVIDDVITTGATMNEAFTILTRSGARPVAGCAVAVAGF
jgi:ComF family protein